MSEEISDEELAKWRTELPTDGSVIVVGAGALDAWIDRSARLLAHLDAVTAERDEWVQRHHRLAEALCGLVSDESGECVACGGSAVADLSEHHPGCWVGDEISGLAFQRANGQSEAQRIM